MSRLVTVRVPGSRRSSGRGAAVAFSDRWVVASFTIDSTRVNVLERAGTLRDLTLPPSEDRVVAAFRAACIRAGRPVPDDLRIRVSSDIDVGRGLGASAAAAVAGAIGARALLDLPLSDDAIVSAASTADGSIAQVVASFEAHECTVRGVCDDDVVLRTADHHAEARS